MLQNVYNFEKIKRQNVVAESSSLEMAHRHFRYEMYNGQKLIVRSHENDSSAIIIDGIFHHTFQTFQNFSITKI